MPASEIGMENAAVILEAIRRGATERDLHLMQQIAEEGKPLVPLIDNPAQELQNPGIELPSEVKDKISYTAWTGLSRVICEGWIQNQKWLMSESMGYDIGTPETVRLMVEKNPTNSRGVFYVVQHRIKRHEIADFERLTAIGYLLRTNFNVQLSALEDEHGRDQLEGEVRRYWARKNGILQPKEVVLTKAIVDDYCTTYGLNGASDRFTERLSL